MAEGILYGIAQEILKNLGSRALDETALAWGFKDRLDKLKATINTIKNVLLDAEERQLDSHAVRDWLERLAIVVYAADDLFDEVATIASRKQAMGGNKLAKEVRTFFSSSNQIKFALSISRKIKDIKEKLDVVKENAQFVFHYRSLEQGGLVNINRGRVQTHSYVDETEVIGRDGDKKTILALLFASSESENDSVISVVPIVGIGGQGKTTLAQIVYNDPQVVKYFELRMWVCVSEEFDVKVISEKILKSASNMEKGSEMDQLQGLLRNKLSDNRYLLVLDDVWNENRDEWLKLLDLLKIGRKGSKILVTTRSREVAKIMGTVPPHELQGLIEDESWELFRKMAFEPGKAEAQPNLIKVGKEIVKKCANVPLAIRSLGSLLYGQSESKWLKYKDTSLAHINTDQTDIMSILKLSYNHLWSPLKNCFTYCSLFPKDHEFDKETLIALWVAEGFIIPEDFESQSLEQLGEEYFLTLLQRSFFQDIRRNEWGEIMSCKMHDLIHDLAQNVVGLNCKVVNSGETNFDTKIHHLSFDYNLNSRWKIPTNMLNLKHLRTFLRPVGFEDGSPFSKAICEQLISTFSCLRVLDLRRLGIERLPSSIGQLIHLRYLDLSETQLRELPKSTTKLQNLQTLKLFRCSKLKRLPTNIRALTNLRCLDVRKCLLTYMPSGIGELTFLHTLPRFIVKFSRVWGKLNSAKLSDLEKLNGLRGALRIEFIGYLRDFVLEAKEANLSTKEGLTEVKINFPETPVDECSHDEAILEGLKPHPNLRKLNVKYYYGEKLPNWLMMNNVRINLPNLVEVKLENLNECLQVPSFGELPFLKRLSLWSLGKVEYMEMEANTMHALSSEPGLMETTFFPSLEVLKLEFMGELKGWWKEVGETSNDDTEEALHRVGKQQILLSMSFPKLAELRIGYCPKLKYMPLCPNVEVLRVVNTDGTLSMSRMGVSPSKLKELSISDVHQLLSLPSECLHRLIELVIIDELLVDIEEEQLKEVFKSMSSLSRLCFFNCESLRSAGEGLGNLPALELLQFGNCQQLDLSINEEEFPWKNMKGLWKLFFYKIPKLVSLPSGLQHLPQLSHLCINNCVEFKELPAWITCLSSLTHLELIKCPKLTCLPACIRNLTSLQQLEIINCPRLTRICRPPNGTEWPKIQHISFVSIKDED